MIHWAQWHEGAHLSGAMAFLTSWPIWVFFGLLTGSFVNVVAYRWPKMAYRSWWQAVADNLQERESWAQHVGGDLPVGTAQAEAMQQALSGLRPLTLSVPRSSCPSCGHMIHWWANVPVVSWLFLRARCHWCDAPISWRYPVVEIAVGLLFGALSWRYVGDWKAILLLSGVAAALVAAALIDADEKLIPDEISFGVLWVALFGAAFGLVPGMRPGGAIVGAAGAYLCLAGSAWLFQKLRGKQGLGGGDPKLMAAGGALLGPQAIPLLVAISAGSFVVAMLLSRRRGEQPFGPYIVLAVIGGLLAPGVIRL